MAFVNERPGTKPSDGWRTIDYERDVILKSLGGLPHGGGSWFNLSWKGEDIHFGAYDKLNGWVDEHEKSKGLNQLFIIFQIKIPELLEPYKEEILILISEALSEYKVLYGKTEGITQVQVDFSHCRYCRS